MAEREGFEPSEPVRVHLISNQAHSATLSSLQICEKKSMESDPVNLNKNHGMTLLFSPTTPFYSLIPF